MDPEAVEITRLLAEMELAFSVIRLEGEPDQGMWTLSFSYDLDAEVYDVDLTMWSHPPFLSASSSVAVGSDELTVERMNHINAQMAMAKAYLVDEGGQRIVIRADIPLAPVTTKSLEMLLSAVQFATMYFWGLGRAA